LIVAMDLLIIVKVVTPYIAASYEILIFGEGNYVRNGVNGSVFGRLNKLSLNSRHFKLNLNLPFDQHR